MLQIEKWEGLVCNAMFVYCTMVTFGSASLRKYCHVDTTKCGMILCACKNFGHAPSLNVTIELFSSRLLSFKS